MLDETNDGLVNNATGTRGMEIKGADRTDLLRASTDEDGSNPLVFVPVDFNVSGDTTEVEDVVTGSIRVENGNVLFEADATDESEEVLIRGDLKITGELEEGADI